MSDLSSNWDNSNFFSNFCDRSSNWIHNEKKEEETSSKSDENIGSISSEIERNLNFLDDFNSVGKKTDKVKTHSTSNSESEKYDEFEDNSKFSFEGKKNFNCQRRVSVGDPVNITNCRTRYSSNDHLERILIQKMHNAPSGIYPEQSNENSDVSFSNKSSTSQINLSASQSKNSKNNQNFNLIHNFNNQTNQISHFNLNAMNQNYLIPQNLKASRHNSLDFTNMPQNLSNFPTNNNIVSMENNLKKLFTINNLNIQHNFYNLLNDEKYLLDNILILLKDQNGCRLIQKKIEEKNLDFISNFFEKIAPNLNEIVIDQFGNYVIQKFIEVSYNERNFLLNFYDNLRNTLYTISVNPYGTRVFQRTVDLMSANLNNIQNLDLIFENLKELIINHTYDLILDKNGNHVFQKILLMYPKNKNQFIYDELCKISFEVAKLKQGGCIFQRAFEMASHSQKRLLVVEILKHIDVLINDEYGNFIIQQIVYLKHSEFNDMIFMYIKENLLLLSKRKFSSNVLDKVKFNLIFSVFF